MRELLRINFLKIIAMFIVFNIGFTKDLNINSVMPLKDYDLNNINGQTITLDQIRGPKGTLVIFSCNTCPWVLRWEDRYVKIAQKYIKQGIGMIALNSNVAKFDGDDSLIKMKKHARDKKYNFPYAQDPNAKLAYAFGATKTPHVYLFDDNDNLVYRGAIDDNARNASNVDEPFLTNALDQLLAGKKIKKSTSKAIGCSIKLP